MRSQLNIERKLIAGRSVRWNNERAALAYQNGLWVPRTLADCLRQAAAQTPGRVLLIDGEHRVDCQGLLTQATALAQAMLASARRSGSVVSFMLPNWHEAAVIYLAATLAGMVVNPDPAVAARPRPAISFLEDVGSRLDFRPRHASASTNYVRHGGAASPHRLPTPPHVIVSCAATRDAHTCLRSRMIQPARHATRTAHALDPGRASAWCSTPPAPPGARRACCTVKTPFMR
jgi:non-ribosomal peptide synthetase component E (peptide arylation enzyme)